MTKQTEVFQNIRSKYGDEKCIKAYEQFLYWSNRPKSHSGPVTAMSYVAMTGRWIKEQQDVGA